MEDIPEQVELRDDDEQKIPAFTEEDLEEEYLEEGELDEEEEEIEEFVEEEEEGEDLGAPESHEKQSQPSQSSQPRVHEILKQFTLNLNEKIKKRQIEDLAVLYESYFKITEKFLRFNPWPAAEAVAVSLGNDPLVVILYKELQLRNLKKSTESTLDQYIESWKNYTDLFKYLINGSENLELSLPSQWMWDIVFYFTEQIQSFYRFRAKLRSRSPEELNKLKANPQVWNVGQALGLLQSIVKKSNIVNALEKPDEIVQKDISQHPVYRAMGHFSLVGLLKVQCLLGDYHLALKTVGAIDITAKAPRYSVPACQIVQNYFIGFAYVMMGRYFDAIKTFSYCLVYIIRTNAIRSRNFHTEYLETLNKQMYGLLSICISLCPQRVDEQVHNRLREEYDEKMSKMRKGDRATFEPVFLFSCPPFISPIAPNYDLALKDPNKQIPDPIQEFTNNQMKLFWNEVSQQSLIPNIRSYLKLYTTIEISRLAGFLEVDPQELKTQLMCYKHKTRGLVWTSGAVINADRVSISDIDFYLDKEMVHIQDANKVSTRRYSDYFIRQTNKFNDLLTS